jgi:hypothetical protein
MENYYVACLKDDAVFDVVPMLATSQEQANETVLNAINNPNHPEMTVRTATEEEFKTFPKP